MRPSAVADGLKTMKDNIPIFQKSASGRLEAIKERHTLALRLSSKSGISIDSWSTSRRAAYAIVRSHSNEVFTAAVTSINILFFIIEVDARASCLESLPSCVPVYISLSSILFMLFYTFEALLRLSAERIEYPKDPWNLLDTTIVICGIIELVLAAIPGTDEPSKFLGYLRMLRIFRILRAVKLLQFFPELHKLAVSFVGTMKALFWGFIMIMAMLIMWSIVCVEMMEPIREKASDDYCSVMFSGVLYGTLFLFQTIVAGDSWGLCIMPLIKEYWYMFFPFAAALVTVLLGCTNLILAVIVDAAADAKDAHLAIKVREKQEQTEKHVTELYRMMKSMDADKSGSISKEELFTAYDTIPEMPLMLLELGIDKGDLEKLYEFLDYKTHAECRDAISYEDLIETILKAEIGSQNSNFMILNLAVKQIDAKLIALKHELASHFGKIMTEQEPKLDSERQDLEQKLSNCPKASHLQVGSYYACEGDLNMVEDDVRQLCTNVSLSVQELLATTARQADILSSRQGMQFETSSEQDRGPAFSSGVSTPSQYQQLVASPPASTRLADHTKHPTANLREESSHTTLGDADSKRTKASGYSLFSRV
eukprot:TRINITY_DN40334_c0_g1_i1.p1 TRINITY_DN40334_c0_g1~~TRINITY_DN40334_c0_g1_i1.p1  ORF type:complete len:596 (-),score=111.41 TRINITY_DN40334_c0_g1_i1:178-1965(-)